MRLILAGGMGEHGRSCFYAEGSSAAYIVDCGIMAGDPSPYPHLAPEQIQRAQVLFLTHSHKDHTGALGWIIQNGFRGVVVASEETFAQLGQDIPGKCPLERLVGGRLPACCAGLSVQWGRTGHCAGSVWYRVTGDGRTLLFSGDYIEGGLCYACDPMEGLHVDAAVLDSAYGSDPRTPETMREEFLAQLNPNTPTLLPVPKYGRGLEMALLIHQRFPDAPLYGDAHFQQEITGTQRIARWLQDGMGAPLSELPVSPMPSKAEQPGFYFLSAPQLDKPEEKALAEQTLQAGGQIILTGNTNKGSGSERLLNEGKARMQRFPVHLTNTGRIALEARNHFAIVIPYHSSEHPAPNAKLII